MKYNFKKEWTDAEHQEAIRLFARWETLNLRIVHGRRERNTEDTYGLPYTSSGGCAGVWNTNVDAVLKADERYRFDGLVITDVGEVMVLLTADLTGGEHQLFLKVGDTV